MVICALWGQLRLSNAQLSAPRYAHTPHQAHWSPPPPLDEGASSRLTSLGLFVYVLCVWAGQPTRTAPSTRHRQPLCELEARSPS